ncbi:MAG: DNA recombination/repair protein RecA, partial [Rhodospirillales bacterium]|nr:DNA recombination/repair protein RecA [Rhodospirillales bacterium]
IGQGRENAKDYLKENPPVATAIDAAIRQNAGLVSAEKMKGMDELADAANAAEPPAEAGG